MIPPPWRVDMHRQVDLIEEVGRHHGFEHLPTTFPAVEQAPPPSDPRIARDRRVRTALLGMGFSEAITFAFIEADSRRAVPQRRRAGRDRQPAVGAVRRRCGRACCRASSTRVSHNRRHGRADVRLFEIGTRFSPSGETRGAGFGWTGSASSDHWSGARRAVDFFNVKGVVEQLGATFQVAPAFAGVERGAVPGMGAKSRSGWRQDHRRVRSARAGDCSGPRSARRGRDLRRRRSISTGKRRLAGRDAARDDAAAIPVGRARHLDCGRRYLSAETVRGTIRSAAPDTLIQVREFDRYQGKGIPDGKVSLSFR